LDPTPKNESEIVLGVCVMNERIRELAYDAEELADAEVDTGSEFHPAFCRIFAELIVRECIKLLPEDCQSPNGCHTSWVIKEHFGVEE
jgi:hypothetical protein